MKSTYKYYSIILMAFSLIFISCGTAPSGTQQGITQQTASSQILPEPDARQSILMLHLQEQGYEPNIDIYGDIQFERGDNTYIITTPHNRPNYTIMYIRFRIASREQRDFAVAKALEINELYLVRAYIKELESGELFQIATDIFLKEADNFKILLPLLFETFDAALDILF